MITQHLHTVKAGQANVDCISDLTERTGLWGVLEAVYPGEPTAVVAFSKLTAENVSKNGAAPAEGNMDGFGLLHGCRIYGRFTRIKLTGLNPVLLAHRI